MGMFDNMFEVSKERNWKNITSIIFIFFCLISLAFFMGLYMVISGKEEDTGTVTGMGTIWGFLLLAWLGARYYYRLIRKNNSNRIKRN